MRVLPFAGTRYGQAAGDAGRLAAPPFDQIDAGLRSRLHAEPLQFAHLTRPDPAGGTEPGTHAAALHRRWLQRGVVRRDDERGFYPYEILLAGGGRRLGLATLLALEPPGSKVVQPHEQTVARTVAERLALLRATRCDFEPILLLADDGGALDGALADAIQDRQPLVDHLDADGHRHRLYRQPASAGYPELLKSVGAVIADGHHRWQVATDYAAETAAAASSPAAAKLVVLTSLRSPGLTIDPIHRGLTERFDLIAAAELAAERRVWQGDGGGALAAAVAASPQPALGVVVAAGPVEIWRLEPDSRLVPERAALVACRLHEELLPRLGLNAAAATDGTVAYRSDPHVLWQELLAGRQQLGFFLPPMSPQAFGDALAGGGLMPPKSTRFLPKLASGLVWFDHATGPAAGGSREV